MGSTTNNHDKLDIVQPYKNLSYDQGTEVSSNEKAVERRWWTQSYQVSTTVADVLGFADLIPSYSSLYLRLTRISY